MRAGTKFGDVGLVDTMMKDGLMDSFNNYHMGITGGSVEGVHSIPNQNTQDFLSSRC